MIFKFPLGDIIAPVMSLGYLLVSLNYFNDIKAKAGLARGDLFYIDVLKIFKLFCGITDIKREIAWFYFRLILKGRKKIADKAISKMGRKKLSVWMKL